MHFAKAVKDVVDNYTLLKKLRSKDKYNQKLEIKKKLKQEEQEKEMQKFKEITGKKRLKYAKDNSSHLKTKAAFIPLLKIKSDYSNKVPDYLKDLAETGIDIEQVLKVSEHNNQDSSAYNIKAVHQSMKKMEQMVND